MFSYFGSKSKFLKYYPEPTEGLIIEPFAGSARYACRYHTHDVWLNDDNPVITEIWKWLRGASVSDVKSLPELKAGDDLRDYDLPEPVRNLLGFAVTMGAAIPNDVMTGWAAKRGETSKLKERLLPLIGNISHWKITCGCYSKMANQNATWFIDPPPFRNGDLYPTAPVIHAEIAQWCKRRRGQVIVCAQEPEDWLDFKILKVMRRRRYGRDGNKAKEGETANELMWYRGTQDLDLLSGW